MALEIIKLTYHTYLLTLTLGLHCFTVKVNVSRV